VSAADSPSPDTELEKSKEERTDQDQSADRDIVSHGTLRLCIPE
jgi:hypothetical protein